MKRFITTPIYYVNSIPHIGHAYTTIICDTLKKYYTLNGDDVFLLTGTDEHGQKIEQVAKKNNINVKIYADSISSKFKTVWDDFRIDYDKFIRTTDLEHKLGVQKAFKIMFDKGDIYKSEYEGRYCISDESFYAPNQLIDEIYCPDCGRETVTLKEESYFFKLSKYEKELLEWYKTDCILPLHKKNEAINFVENGLNDLSITRTSFEWGIKIPNDLNDPKHIIYVWLDALMNYINAFGYANNQENNNMDYLNNMFHVVGKDILKFHAIYWPAFLLSLNLPLPKRIFVHGWWTINGVKMSKSIGNVIDPVDVKNKYESDIFRYFLLKEVPFGQDGDYSEIALINRNNGELSNVLGNLLNRLIGMSERFFESNLDSVFIGFENEVKKIDLIIENLHNFMNNMQPNKYLDNLWEILHFGNELITKLKPWELIKVDSKKTLNFLILISNILCKTALLLFPIMPDACLKIAICLGVKINKDNFKNLILENKYLDNFKITKIDPLFPKIEIKPKEEQKKQEVKIKNQISIKDFSKIDIRIGTIKEVEIIEKSDKLLKLKVDLGESNLRQIISGIKKFYNPQELLENQVCVITNLEKVSIMGEISEGMILTCEDKDGLSLLGVKALKVNGSKIN